MGIVFANPADLISHALEGIGVLGFGRTASAREIESGRKFLNVMLDEWGVLRENISVRTSRNFPLVVAKNPYTIGNGGDFDTTGVRPIKIESAYYRDSNNTDFPLDVTLQEKDYADITVKDVNADPTRLFYKPSYPLGIITFDSVPINAYQLYLLCWDPFTKITDVSDAAQLSYPDGYEAAIVNNLKIALCTPNRKTVTKELELAAITSLQAIQAAYSEIPTVTNWDLPGAKRARASFFNMDNGQ